jgi:dihydropteroate synthase
MARYSIRRLLLFTRESWQAELGKSHSFHIEMVYDHSRRYSWILKVNARHQPITPELFREFSLWGITCWPASPTTAYLFTEPAALVELTHRQNFTAQDEPFAAELAEFLEREQRDHFQLNIVQRTLAIGSRTLIMGVLNCTPDSFSDGGLYLNKEAAIERGLRMIEQGADIIDVGGESTRPAGTYGEGAQPVSEAEEMERVLPVIEALAKTASCLLSIDTYKSAVAEAAIRAGAGMVNDVSGFRFDPQMPAVVARHQTPAVIMHIKGTPRDMQQNPSYENLMDELYQFFEQQLDLAQGAGIAREQIILDPGLGFGKRLRDNYEILQRLEEFRGLGCPLLVGPSRKSFIGTVLELPVHERLEGTAAVVALAVAHSAHIVRVHDVKEMRRVVKIADVITGRTALQPAPRIPGEAA